MGWFGPSKDEVWRQLSQEIGAEYVEGGFWKGKKVQAHVGPWTITLDTHTESSGESSVTYTRLRAPYVNPDGFRFTIYRRGFFTDLGKLLGMQDIEVGEPEFDEVGPKIPEDVGELHFQVVGVIKDVERLKALFDLFVAVLDQLCRIGLAYEMIVGVIF